MKVIGVETDLLRVPLPRQVSMPAAQDARPATHVDVVIVRLLTDGPHTGLGFTYSFGGGVALRSIIDTVIAPIIVGHDPLATEWLFLKAWAELEGVGFAGLAARAYAAVDFALWDVKGKVANMPVARVLGGYRARLKAIVSDTATPALGAKQAVKETKLALTAGAAGVQVEVGTVDPELDEERLKQLREGVPDGAWFEISAGGRYDFSTAAWMGQIGEQDFGIDSFCDPLRLDDLDNLGRLIDRLEVGISVGASADRPADHLRIIDRGGISAIRIDPLRLGGITPARKITLVAELKQIAIYPARLPEIGVHLCGSAVYGRMCEYVDWFAELFAGGPRFENGQLVVPTGPGLGISVCDDVAAKWRV